MHAIPASVKCPGMVKGAGRMKNARKSLAPSVPAAGKGQQKRWPPVVEVKGACSLVDKAEAIGRLACFIVLVGLEALLIYGLGSPCRG